MAASRERGPPCPTSAPRWADGGPEGGAGDGSGSRDRPGPKQSSVRTSPRSRVPKDRWALAGGPAGAHAGRGGKRAGRGAAGAVSPSFCECRKPWPLPDPHHSDLASHSAHQSGLQHSPPPGSPPASPSRPGPHGPSPHGWPGTLCSRSSLVCEPWDPGRGLACVHRTRGGVHRPSWPGPEAAGVTRPRVPWPRVTRPAACHPAPLLHPSLWHRQPTVGSGGQSLRLRPSD